MRAYRQQSSALQHICGVWSVGLWSVECGGEALVTGDFVLLLVRNHSSIAVRSNAFAHCGTAQHHNHVQHRIQECVTPVLYAGHRVNAAHLAECGVWDWVSNSSAVSGRCP